LKDRWKGNLVQQSVVTLVAVDWWKGALHELDEVRNGFKPSQVSIYANALRG